MTDEGSARRFLRLLVEAWDRPDRQGALTEALEEMARWAITHKGDYANFCRFMEEVGARLLADPSALQPHFRDLLEELLTALVTDTWEGSEESRGVLLQVCNEHPLLQRELERVRSELAPHLVSEPMELIIYREGDEKARVQVPLETRVVPVPEIVPGRYTLALSTGRVLWQGSILPREVLWAEAYPGRDLAMAARTEESRQEPTRSERLLAGELEVRLYPGLESGTLEITRLRAGE